ncbi:MAG: heme ABC transporter permease [Parvularculaceae bacterium]|nr:heme ABC transporter permease [Parvularculaceae bacterium]
MKIDLANPERFDRLARPLTPAFGVLALLLGAAGLWLGLFASPADYQQGETVRIMYVHVPAAWMALFCYSSMAFASAAGFIFKHPLADVAARATAPIGAVFTALALITGSLWGKPMWGTWWAWDARLTSVLVLFFLYLGYIAIWEAIEDRARAARIAAIVALVGFVNVPIIKFSVDWWNSLHQPASVFRGDGPTIHGSMLTPLLLMGAAYMAAYAALLLASMRNAQLAARLERLERLGEARAATIVQEPAPHERGAST